MAISDEERRDIAAGLREAAAHPDVDGDVYCGCLVDCGLLQRGTYRGHFTPESVERLADLVDRPTCNAYEDWDYMEFESPDVRVWACQGCGERFPVFRGSLPLYCPVCGAKVIRDDD